MSNPVNFKMFRQKNECLDWQPSQFINIVGKDDVNPAGLDSNKERLREVST
jgi:hypothetical protein